MTQEDKQLLLVDLCARLPYNPIVYVDENLPRFKLGAATRVWEYIAVDKPSKPYLRPMSSMTEGEAKEIAILHDIKDILSVKVTSDYIDVIVDDGVCSTERRTIWYDEIVSSVKCFDFLTAHHFDYRGLIEKGLAIEAPEKMYN